MAKSQIFYENEEQKDLELWHLHKHEKLTNQYNTIQSSTPQPPRTTLPDLQGPLETSIILNSLRTMFSSIPLHL